MWLKSFVIIVLYICHVSIAQNTAVLILARGGSKGIRLKNLSIVGGISLLARSILTAHSAGFEDITVSTDHPLIALETLKYGANIFKRSHVTSTDWAPSIWGVLEYINTRPDIDILILLQATSPFVKAKYLNLSLQKLNSPIPFDCIFSATLSHKLRWKYNKTGVYPINFKYDNRPRRQDWSGELLETGAFYICRKELIKKGYLQNNNCTVWEVSQAESLEVDTEFELHLANILLYYSFKNMSVHTEEVTFETLETTDVISVELVPERKGLILKHCEYYVSSRRHGTTVTRRYNEFVQLCDVLCAKYPYRAVCSLPPKRVVVGGGSPLFLQRRRAALQRWLTLVARHPVIAHDADLRTFLCETSPRLDKPKHDEFILAGTQEDNARDMSTDEMQETFVSEQEQLRLAQLGLGRLFKIIEKVEGRCESERADIRELGAALSALSSPSAADTARWARMREALRAAAELAMEVTEPAGETGEAAEDEAMARTLLALDALSAHRALCSRLTRGLHAERSAAAAAAPHSAASHVLRARHRYALRCAIEEARVARAYALSALEILPELLRAQGTSHARVAALWADLHTALRHPNSKPTHK